MTMLRRALLVTVSTLVPGIAMAQEQLPTIEVVGVTPVAGSEIDIDKVPSNVQTVGSEAFSHTRSPDLIQSMVQYVPFTALSDQNGNPFQINLDYRGFTASPIQGTPQGIAVYQNGTRINESYGDIVNWDFIPEMAIERMTMMPNNPLFGLNAIGGAMSIDMKNGFTYHGEEAEVRGGSYGRVGGSAQVGVQNGNTAVYVAADATNDDGWRMFSSSSQLRRMYADVGEKGNDTEFHVSFTGADDHLGAVAFTPIQLLSQSYNSVYTFPQDTHLQLAFLQGNANWKPTDTLSVQANGYFRGYWQSHDDGNGTDGQSCNNPAFLCIIDGNTPINITGPTPNNLPGSAYLGEIDRNWVSTNSYGGSLQATYKGQVFGHDNHFVVGASIDHGRTQFTGTSELCEMGFNLDCAGVGVFIDQPLDDVAPVSLLAFNTYTGIYATDTFDVTSQLSVTAGARYNIEQITLQDETGTSFNSLINGTNNYTRLNPMIGATYKILPQLTIYGSYAEANRAPTPLELGCSSPDHPCIIDNFLLADPPLSQVVSRTYEAGLRGELQIGDTGPAPPEPVVTKAPPAAPVAKPGVLSWSLGVYNTLTSNDIISVVSPVNPLLGFFTNAAKTLRQGIEAKANYKWGRWTAYANFTYIDATYQVPLILPSPNSPFANANGDIFVNPGDHIPGIPDYRLKVGSEYQITDAWKLGGDLNVFGSQYLIHDDSNQAPKVPAYWVVNMHTSYEVTKNVELFGLVQNLFNQHYYQAGTFYELGGFNNVGGGPNLYANLFSGDSRSFVPGMPLAIYGGLRATF
jgi:iron complex outermembrane recepter protein